MFNEIEQAFHHCMTCILGCVLCKVDYVLGFGKLEQALLWGYVCGLTGDMSLIADVVIEILIWQNYLKVMMKRNSKMHAGKFTSSECKQKQMTEMNSGS